MLTLIIGGLIGSIFGAIAKKPQKDRLFNIMAGLVGASLFNYLLGHRGPRLGDMAIFPSISGAILFSLAVLYLLGERK